MFVALLDLYHDVNAASQPKSLCDKAHEDLKQVGGCMLRRSQGERGEGWACSRRGSCYGSYQGPPGAADVNLGRLHIQQGELLLMMSCSAHGMTRLLAEIFCTVPVECEVCVCIYSQAGWLDVSCAAGQLVPEVESMAGHAGCSS